MVTWGSKGIQEVSGGNSRLHEVTWSYKGFKEVTGGHRWLQRVLRGDSE